jgi:uncharacterized protein (TIGR03905 family)
MDPNPRTIVYETHGTCSSRVTIRLEGDTIQDVTFEGGCDGNLQAICRLIHGMDAQEVARRLKGIDCGSRGTSCPDQLAKALTDPE